MSRFATVGLFAFFALVGAAPPSMGDIQSIGENAEAAAKLYLTAARRLPVVDMGAANAVGAASLEGGLAAEQAAAAAALPCPECAHDYAALCPEGFLSAVLPFWRRSQLG